MSEDEKDYHYFRIHDTDKNDRLDGLEVLKAVNHLMEEEMDDINNTTSSSDQRLLLDQQFKLVVELVDKVLELDDIDGDGLLSFAEFVSGRRRGNENLSK
ncbi:multiple coagulation factor deficiency protein 2 [Eurytemora carolleeae]|uniref:multiple coagulation factor deficiency protein 2 n=1 Tax=Eurytemora carolleeae TaxID=1294199 RepID=UPI000C76D1F0|nr:multiple coagulation factor deficiency protein 2 [Eurytemora carolleeae]|eukprot:XP_023348256.1 multiple coagulation factor deficiency protein 2-like [Eurytemora affinis]